MSVGLKGSHHVLLESSDDASPTTSVELILAENEDGSLRWSEKRLSPFPPRQSEGEVGFSHKDPLTDLTWYQSDWTGGAFQNLFDPKAPNKYYLSDGIDLRWPNVAALGNTNTELDFLVRNGGAERNSTSIWTAGTGVTYTANTTTPQTGTYVHRLVTDGSRTDNSVLLSFSLANPTVYQGRTITINAAIRRSAGTESGLKVTVIDGVATVDGTTVTASSFTLATLDITVNAAATAVTIQFKTTVTETAAHTYDIDDVVVSPAGGVLSTGLAELGGNLYSTFGRVVCQLNSANNVWNAVYVHASAIATSIREYNGNIFVAFGNGDNAYIYGATTSWTVSTLAGDAKYAHYFTVSRQTLWKSRYDGGGEHYFLASSTSAINGGSWSTEYTVGSSDRVITGLYATGDTVLAAKEDGLYSYKRVYNDGTSADLFQNLVTEFATDPDPDNFRVGAEFLGALYLSTDRGGFYRVIDGVFQDLSALMPNLRVSATTATVGNPLSPRILAMAGDSTQLWMIFDTPIARSGSTKTIWLCSFWEDSKGFHLHTYDELTMTTTTLASGTNNLIVNNATAAVSGSYVYIAGARYYSLSSTFEAYATRSQLPVDSRVPFQDTTPAHPITTKSFVTPFWDAGLPTDQKAFVALTVWHDNLSSTRTIIPRIRVNSENATLRDLGTINSGSVYYTTVYFDTITTPETNAVGRSIQIQFDFVTNSATSSPRMYAFALQALLKPTRVREWVFEFLVGSNLPLRNNGLASPESKLSILNDLLTLENQVYPIRLTADLDMDGANEFSDLACTIVPGTLERVPNENEQNGAETWRVTVRQVTVS